MVCAIMSIGSQMMTSLVLPNAAQLATGISTRPGSLSLIAVSIAAAVSPPPVG